MTDLILDGLGGNDDFDRSEPSWLDCPMLPRRDMLAVIERCKDLDGRAINLFRTALQGKPRSDLFEHYLRPHICEAATNTSSRLYTRWSYVASLRCKIYAACRFPLHCKSQHLPMGGCKQP